MSNPTTGLTTGIPSLDGVLRGLIPGDNVVWRVDDLDHFRPLVGPYCKSALERGRNLIYFRFADHESLIGEDSGAKVHKLDPTGGLESFITEAHKTIEQSERGTSYLFDCLSGLADHWYSDEMLTNFFLLTCPYLYDVEAIAYFPILKEYHSYESIAPIHDTAQVILDIHDLKGSRYVQPLKVQQRHSPTMHMLHAWRGEEFTPISESATISEVLKSSDWLHLQDMRSHGIWNRTFARAERIVDDEASGRCRSDEADAGEVAAALVKMMITRDERLSKLALAHMGIRDLLETGRRIVGSGLIGGKAVGMLLARAILRGADEHWGRVMEPHDSFYIGSDVFYTFLVRNGVWWMRQQQKDPDNFLRDADRARQRILVGTFPEAVHDQFERMLDYFGQSPIIVRSSSLLEDNFGNAFSGKYESVFCANQGPRERRLDDFLSAVRTIYASTMSSKALTYRATRGILDRDEQMALLVQRVSGAMYGRLHFPQVAGVAFSYNPYVWNEYIDPEAGVMRLVFGLGTRAVDRADDDYTRVVALNAPTRRPETNFDQVKQYAQRRVDVIDFEANQLVSKPFSEIAGKSSKLPIEIFASRDEEIARMAAERNLWDVSPWVLTFDHLLTKTGFVEDMRSILATLQDAYDYPVDVEFAANFLNGECRINVLQCRPFQVTGGGAAVEAPADIPPEKLVFEAHGALIGQSRALDIDRVIYVVPAAYGQMSLSDRYAVADLVGRVVRPVEAQSQEAILLMGPGRWGTTTPWLGVPVSFAQISGVSALCEIVAMREDLIPDVSLGTHFFNDIVETDILYMALFPEGEGNLLNTALLDSLPNRLGNYIDEQEKWSHVLKVIEAADLDPARLRLNANTLEQRAVVYTAEVRPGDDESLQK